MLKTQAWEQGIFGVENARFRGRDLTLENETCTGLGIGHFRGGKCPFSGVGFGQKSPVPQPVIFVY